jgi:hypothetical protein
MTDKQRNYTQCIFLEQQAAALRWLADLDRRGVGLCQPNAKRAAERATDARLLEQRAAQTRRNP